MLRHHALKCTFFVRLIEDRINMKKAVQSDLRSRNWPLSGVLRSNARHCRPTQICSGKAQSSKPCWLLDVMLLWIQFMDILFICRWYTRPSTRLSLMLFVIHKKSPSSLLVKFNPDAFDIKSLGVQQYKSPGLPELGNHDHSHNLSGRTFDGSRFEPWLISGKVDMWAFMYDEWILILERITPYSLSVDSPTSLINHLHKVSGAVGAQFLQRSKCSIISKRSSPGKYLNMSSTGCPAVPKNRHPSMSPSQGFVTLSSQLGSLSVCVGRFA